VNLGRVIKTFFLALQMFADMARFCIGTIN